jgi:hypothetical protein
MNTLPINTIIAPAQTSNKPASNDDAAPQGAQGFGNVLARHVADSSSSSEKNSGQDAKDTNDVKDTKDAKDVQGGKDRKRRPLLPLTRRRKMHRCARHTSLLPADMMAALLANKIRTPPNDSSSASAVDTKLRKHTRIIVDNCSGKVKHTRKFWPVISLSSCPPSSTHPPECTSATNNKQTFPTLSNRQK